VDLFGTSAKRFLEIKRRISIIINITTMSDGSDCALHKDDKLVQMMKVLTAPLARPLADIKTYIRLQ
jgi:hypothetical protein